MNFIIPIITVLTIVVFIIPFSGVRANDALTPWVFMSFFSMMIAMYFIRIRRIILDKDKEEMVLHTEDIFKIFIDKKMAYLLVAIAVVSCGILVFESYTGITPTINIGHLRLPIERLNLFLFLLFFFGILENTQEIYLKATKKIKRK